MFRLARTRALNYEYKSRRLRSDAESHNRAGAPALLSLCIREPIKHKLVNAVGGKQEPQRRRDADEPGVVAVAFHLHRHH